MRRTLRKVPLALFGIFLVGCAVAFNSLAGFGNDSIGIVYDGIRVFAGLTHEQLGMVSNLANWGLVALLFFIGRKYLNLGTLLYILPYGLFVDLGTWLYGLTFARLGFWGRVAAVAAACLMLYLGVGIFIAVDIGLDPINGVIMVIRDRLGWEYRQTKVAFDVCMVALGTLLGGKLGAVTLLTAVTAGPSIQFFADRVAALCERWHLG